MSILWGRKSALIQRHVLQAPCLHCQKTNSLFLEVHQPYLHFLSIPFIPLRRYTNCHCTFCGFPNPVHALAPDTQMGALILMKAARKPLWMYSGLAGIAGLLFIGSILIHNHATRPSVLILDPQVGDVYTMKFLEDSYSLIRIDSLSKDSLYVRFSSYASENLMSTIKLHRMADTLFIDPLIAMPINNLQHLLDEEIIVDIRR